MRVFVLLSCAVLYAGLGYAQGRDELENLRQRAKQAEEQWDTAEKELGLQIRSLDPCAEATIKRVKGVQQMSAAALNEWMKYYREWQKQSAAILTTLQSSERNSEKELGTIRTNLEQVRKDFAGLQTRLTELSRLPEAQGRLANLRHLIETAEASQRQWLEILREYESEAPDRKQRILKVEAAMRKFGDTADSLMLQNELESLRSASRLDRLYLRCPSGRS